MPDGYGKHAGKDKDDQEGDENDKSSSNHKDKSGVSIDDDGYGTEKSKGSPSDSGNTLRNESTDSKTSIASTKSQLKSDSSSSITSARKGNTSTKELKQSDDRASSRLSRTGATLSKTSLKSSSRSSLGGAADDKVKDGKNSLAKVAEGKENGHSSHVSINIQKDGDLKSSRTSLNSLKKEEKDGDDKTEDEDKSKADVSKGAKSTRRVSKASTGVVGDMRSPGAPPKQNAPPTASNASKQSTKESKDKDKPQKGTKQPANKTTTTAPGGRRLSRAGVTTGQAKDASKLTKKSEDTQGW